MLLYSIAISTPHRFSHLVLAASDAPHTDLISITSPCSFSIRATIPDGMSRSTDTCPSSRTQHTRMLPLGVGTTPPCFMCITQLRTHPEHGIPRFNRLYSKHPPLQQICRRRRPRMGIRGISLNGHIPSLHSRAAAGRHHVMPRMQVPRIVIGHHTIRQSTETVPIQALKTTQQLHTDCSTCPYYEYNRRPLPDDL